MQLPLTCFWLFFWTWWVWDLGPLAIEVASSVLVMGEPVMTSFPVTPLRKQWTAWGSRMIAIHQMGYLVLIKNPGRTSLAVQWIRLCLPMQGIPVRPLAPERSHMLWINEDHAPQLLSPCSPAYKSQLLSLCAATPEAHMPRAPAPQQERPLQWEDHTPQQRVAPAHYN